MDREWRGCQAREVVELAKSALQEQDEVIGWHSCGRPARANLYLLGATADARGPGHGAFEDLSPLPHETPPLRAEMWVDPGAGPAWNQPPGATQLARSGYRARRWRRQAGMRSGESP